MCKTLTVGLENDSQINYVDINLHDSHDLEDFCDTLAEYIIEKYEKPMLLRTINHNFCYLNAAEKKEIYQKAQKLKANKQNMPDIMAEYKKIIKENLFDYLEHSNQMILDGFVTFRLKSYMLKLEELVDSAVEEYMIQKEYNEFIELLQYFVEIQQPAYDIIHVLAEPTGNYRLLDKRFCDITRECIADFIEDMTLGELNYDDILISALISLAPKKIYLHQTRCIANKQLLQTIHNVFQNRITVCEGCSVCQMHAVSPESIYQRGFTLI